MIKYHELRNDRVLVLVPKRLRDNWTLYKSNDRRNILASDRFNYDVLNHTDLSRDGGMSGDIDLSHVNWGNYDLVVIDESHNFRNKKTPRAGGETRYDRLMHRIIQQGVKTRVLMLSATPVNNRLADLRNQIAFVTEGNDTALNEHGIESIESTCRTAQRQFNRWLALEDHERTSARLMEMLGFDYFTLLDLLTIARSRKHVEKYYGTSETGKFPDRLKPINIKPDVDSAGQFRSIKEINVANKRFSQNEVGQTVLDAGVTECVLGDHLETPKLLKSLGLSSQPRSNLFALYQGWPACLEAYRAAQITGQFVLASDSASRDARHNALSEYARLERDIATLRSQAEREKQVNRRVELNMQIVDLSKQSDKSRESL